MSFLKRAVVSARGLKSGSKLGNVAAFRQDSYHDPKIPLSTSVVKSSARYQENFNSLLELTNELKENIAEIKLGGGKKARDLHVSLGNL